MEILYATLLVIFSLISWSLNAVGLPGNWFIVVFASLYSWLVSSDTRIGMSWTVVAGLVTLAILGELVEFGASAMGASRAGGSRRSAVLAMVGSLAGGIFGLFAGAAIPIPVVGSLIGGVLCAGLGALVGAVLGEQWKGSDLDASMRVGQAAFWGRILGTLGKIVAGAAMIVVLLFALFL